MSEFHYILLVSSLATVIYTENIFKCWGTLLDMFFVQVSFEWFIVLNIIINGMQWHYLKTNSIPPIGFGWKITFNGRVKLARLSTRLGISLMKCAFNLPAIILKTFNANVGCVKSSTRIPLNVRFTCQLLISFISLYLHHPRKFLFSFTPLSCHSRHKTQDARRKEGI